MIGTKLAHYEITGHLGSGGMGEVYAATDAKLGRSVAIKFLPEAFSHDNERGARFEREARVLASLNHSNIAAIHGLEESGGRKFLVMELVPGETLAQRIERGQIPLEEALEIAKQITEGLEAAHEKGIIHRDLKPANVKITPDGKVKVLDFGLAKAYEPETTNTSLSNSPTLSMAATNAGMILGTAAYMSPEQAKGRTVDRRCDIFSFGCVLYEMLTGRPAFDGDDVTEILGRVVTAEPDWSRLPAGTTRGISRMLRRALKKDARQRLGDIRDARIEMEEAATEVEAPVATPSARGTRLGWTLAAAAVVVAGVLAFPAVRHLREGSPQSLPETRWDIVTPDTADPLSFALSPNGRQIVFVASGDGASCLWLRSLDSSAAQPLAGTEGAAYPFWSPDSRSVGFVTDDHLKVMEIGSPAPRILARVSASRGGGTWSAADVILFVPATRSPLFRVLASGGGEAVAVTKRDGQSSSRFPSFLPDDRHFLFHSSDGPPGTNGIYLGALDSLETWRLAPSSVMAGAYLSSGWLLWVRDGALVAQRLDLERKALTGDAVTLADSVANAVSVSAAGLVAYRTGANARRQLTWFNRSGKPLGTVGSPDENGLNIPSVSADGRRVAAQRRLQSNVDIWVLDETGVSKFTYDAALDRNPIWSPNGKTIVFGSDRRGPIDLYETSGPGREKRILESEQDKYPSDWSRDGRFLLYHSFDAQTLRDIWVLPMDGDRKPCVFLNTNSDERWASFSPNGRWVAYMSNESGTNEIYIRPFACGSTVAHAGEQYQVSMAGGIHPRWRADGEELYYIAFPNAKLMAVRITTTATSLKHELPVELFPTRIPGSAENVREYDVSRDGRFLINTVVDEAASPITILQNWKPPAK